MILSNLEIQKALDDGRANSKTNRPPKAGHSKKGGAPAMPFSWSSGILLEGNAEAASAVRYSM
jgi:hypothetical protein